MTIARRESLRIAAITTVRNDSVFLDKWIRYYGSAFGRKNLYVFLDGHDQIPPESAQEINTLYLPHIPLDRVPADRRRARVMSNLARGLFKYFDAVLVMDVDEFLIVDPLLGVSLPEYLSGIQSRATVSGLGLDVGQHLELEDTDCILPKTMKWSDVLCVTLSIKKSIPMLTNGRKPVLRL